MCPWLRLLPLAYGLWAVAFAAASRADDTDIYINGMKTTGTEPLVFLALDYHPALASTLCIESEPSDPDGDCAGLLGEAYANLDDGPGEVTVLDGLRAVLRTLFAELDGVSVALAVNRADGDHILQGLGRFEQDDGNGTKQAMLTAIDELQPPVDSARPYQQLYEEIPRYLRGSTGLNDGRGWEGYGRDAACSAAFAVNILFDGIGGGAEYGDEKASAARDFARAIADLYQTDFAPGLAGRQNLRSFFLVPQADAAADLYARAGGTAAAIALDSPADLLRALQGSFRQMLSVSASLVAASVPVNTLHRASLLDNVYLALFEVDQDRRPYWNGNLKKLRLQEGRDEYGAPTASLVDARGRPALAIDGRIAFDALSYWTDPAALPPPAAADEVAGTDGRSVTRGGAGQRIPGYLHSPLRSIGDDNGPNTRRLLTEPFSSNAASRLPGLGVRDGARLREALGVDAVGEAEELIRWLRGQDRDDLDGDGDRSDSRPWLLGPPLHSRPLPVNYGARAGYSRDNPDIRIFMGSDHGFMHAFRNTAAAGAGSGAGVEDWAFMPRAVMDKMAALRANRIADPHPYTVDGAPAAYIYDADGDGSIGLDAAGDKDQRDLVYLFFGLRRGGRAYYGLDVTDPDNPAFLWSLQRVVDGSGGSGSAPQDDFAELGLTFSVPRVGTVKYGPQPTPVLFFGGGYDPNKDNKGSDRASMKDDSGRAVDSEGNAIYVVNAATGDLVWKATYGPATGPRSASLYHHRDLRHSIPSDVAAVDGNGNGNIDRLYVGDTGGGVWRVDLPEDSRDSRRHWAVSKLASLSDDGGGGGGDGGGDRRFFHRPDVVPGQDRAGPYDGVVIGSGDRAAPLGRGTVNYLYLLKDRAVSSLSTGAGTGASPSAVSTYNHRDYAAVGNPAGLTDVTTLDAACLGDAACSAGLHNGWKLRLQAAGEKALSPPLTVFGTVYFTTYVPSAPGGLPGTPESLPGASSDDAGQCEPAEGRGRLYAVRLADGAAAGSGSLGSISPDSVNPSRPPASDSTATDADGGGANPGGLRYRDLQSGGIPAEAVMVGGYLLSPDLTAQPAGERMFWKTFWYEKDADEY